MSALPPPDGKVDFEVGVLPGCQAYVQVGQETATWATWQAAVRAAESLQLAATAHAYAAGATREQVRMVRTAIRDQIHAQAEDTRAGGRG